MDDNILRTIDEVKDFIARNEYSVVLYGNYADVNSTVMENCIDPLRPQYPLVGFGFVISARLAEKMKIAQRNSVAFYHHGRLLGLYADTEHPQLIRQFVQMMIRKD